jgi:hypothetical protein
MASKATIKHKVMRLLYALEVLEKGLNGRPATLGSTDADSVLDYLHVIGISLTSKTALTKMGYRLKRGAKPLMIRYYGVPIQKYSPLYDLNSQCVRKDSGRGYEWCGAGRK